MAKKQEQQDPQDGPQTVDGQVIEAPEDRARDDIDTTAAAEPAGRAERLYWAGDPDDPNGFHFAGIPARDLDEYETAALTEAQYQDATESGLYRTSKPRAASKE